MTTLHGIRNCDTVKKARRWLDERGLAYRFHDFKEQGAAEPLLREWVAELGWQALLNRSGTTFRKLPEGDKVDLDGHRAIALMLAHPSAIRRPVLEGDGGLLVGFDAQRYADRFEGGGAALASTR